MQARILTLIISAALLGAGCASKETKPETVAAPAPAAEPVAKAPEPAPVASKPVCPPEPSAKVKTTKSGKAAKAKEDKKAKKDVAAQDCEPASAKSSANTTTAAPAETPATKSAVAAKEPTKETTSKEAAKPGDAQKPRVVKSRDGTFEGEVYGNIPPGSKWAKLQIGMEQPEVERILGGTSHEVRVHPTAKAFIPFYYGTDSHRYEVVYRGQGSVSYTGGGWGAGRGVLMMINYDPNI